MGDNVEKRLQAIESRGKRRDPVTEDPCDEWWLCSIVRALQAEVEDNIVLTNRLEKLRLEPGDVILVRYDHQSENINAFLRHLCEIQVPTGAHAIVVLPDGMDLESLTEEAMNRSGWVKAPTLQ